MELEPVIGFEVHAQLATRSKIFCGCPNEPAAMPNSRVCPVCLGLPGALPVLNEAVLDLGIRVALALHATVSERMSFARKNYFYPDLPKGYQITQFAEPLAVGGHLDVETDGLERRVRVRQVHLEEDAGKTIHSTGGERASGLVDMNRCGVPLIEIVTEPDMASLAQADAFLSELHRILVFLGVSAGRMHLGEVRFDTNVSVRERGSEEQGSATEIKNLNSFRAARKALAFEIERQTRLVASGGAVVHETLLWDAVLERALPMRSKEREHDYRYFSEPDLPPVRIGSGRVESVRSAMPELPAAMRARFVESYGIAPYDAAVLTSDPGTAACFELTLSNLLGTTDQGATPDCAGVSGGDRLMQAARTAGRWVSVIAPGILGGAGAEEGAPPAGVDLVRQDRSAERAQLLTAVLAPLLRGEISEPAAKTLLEKAAETGEEVDELIVRLGLSLLSDEDELRRVARGVLDRNQDEVRRYRAGEVKLLRFFMGEVMRETGGAADPVKARSILEGELAG